MEREALYDKNTNTNLSYQGLYVEAYDLAKRLPIEPGDRVLIYDVNSLDWVITFFAIQLRKGVVVPVDTRVSKEFIQDAIDLVEPELIISDTFSDTSITSLTYEQLKKVDSD